MKPLVFLTLLSLCLFSCHKEEEAERVVKFVVECDDPEAWVYVETEAYHGVISGYWESELVTGYGCYWVEAVCTTPDAWLTMRMYVDGNLEMEESQKGEVRMRLSYSKREEFYWN